MAPNPDTGVLPQDARIGRTALRVTDLTEMTEFYRTVVGFTVLRQSETTAVLGVSETPLLVLKRDADAPDRHRSAAGLFHNAFRVPSREALGDALARLQDRWQLGGASDHGVSEALYTTDPEGNGIEIYRDFPRSEWPAGTDGGVQMTTRPLDLDPIEAAAAGAGASALPAGTDVGHVHLEASSLDAFRDFYVDTIGFEIRATVPDAVFVAADGYHHHVAGNTWNHRTEPVDGRGLSWFEIVVPESAALETIRERLAASQHTVTELDDGIAVTGPDEIEVRFRVES
ncbi:Glyoxalase/bleomycin resistance protein/dioxygenase [Natrialba hulunbeirensis JCM 10989]|uniref:Glyoxalase/bleomycin resistance protein/dioxygenase n=1 Tax=Natrialba hulunbeirensis JCM 10989 TaxID=1227493 RepID=M0A692_9EURY|nr:VOC family protein [Natrialba hulunbeirensis]ELY93412.1 Glyoxalase/bleomycin resistance protein/dioxygenase [Natrialba hulunbeirensis JCM 10989]